MLSEKAGTSFHIVLAPPTCHCLKCGEQLTPQISLATNVMVFELGGPKIATKYRYRLVKLVINSVICKDIAGAALVLLPMFT